MLYRTLLMVTVDINHVKYDKTRERLEVENVTERCRKARLGWFEHVKIRDQEYFGRQTLDVVQPGRRRRGRQNIYVCNVSTET